MLELVNIKKLIFSDCRKAIGVPLLLSIIEKGLEGLLTIYTAKILGEFATSIFKLDVSYGLANIINLAICIVITVLIVPIIRLISNMFLFRNALKHDRTILSRFLDKNYGKMINSINPGEAQYRLEMDPINFRINWMEVRTKTIIVPLTLGYLIYNALQLSIPYTLITFAIALVRLVIPIVVRKLQAKYDLKTREYNTKVRQYETEITTQPYIIRMFGFKAGFLAKLDMTYKKFFEQVQSKSITYNKIADTIASLFNKVALLIILFVGAIMVANKSIEAGAVASMIGFYGVFNTIINDISYIIKNTKIIDNLVERIYVLYQDTEKTSGENITSISRMTADGLSYSYGEQAIFKGVNFDIDKGYKVAICGGNGTGKSTLIKLICGLIGNYGGRLIINNNDLQDISITSWRDKIAYAMQDPYLFEGTVKENVRLGNLDASEEKIDQVMKEIGISHMADRLISTDMKELSGGEKQKISIARAILKDTTLLFLDEPSNNLDIKSIKWLNEFIQSTDKTVMYVTHHNNMMSIADSIINL